MRNVTAAACALGFGAIILAACSSNDDAGDNDDSQTTSSEAALSASDIMTRANQYIAAKIVYCGGPRGGEDETSCGEGICEQPVGPWNAYRSDCSGFVSYVWQIPSDPDTATYSYDQSGSQGWTTIGIDSLRAGDAVVAEGHIKLFSKFEGSGPASGAAEIYEEYDCNKLGRKAVQSFSRSGSEILFAGDSRPYHAIRRNALTPPAPPAPPGPPTPTPAPVKGCGTIPAGHGLAPGKAVRSCDNRFELVMQGDGNLVEYGPVGAMWTTETSHTDGHVADMQGDGNFVLYGKTSDAKWNSHTSGHPGSVLDIQNDGNIVIRDGGKALWSTGTTFPNAPAGPTACGALNPGHGLAAGKKLTSCDGRFSLDMQTDGNLVLYKGATALWNTKTAGDHGYAADMQADGNFVVYDWKGKAIWSSGTAGHGGAKLDVQSDGNVVLYAGAKAVWSSGTSGR